MPPERPSRLVIVAGTGTGVGKTWTAARVARRARAAGRRVAARKPVQSFAPDDPSPTDAAVLAAATAEAVDDVCPPHRSYPRAMAPFMAADALGLPAFTLDELVAELAWPPNVDVGLVEPAGGVRSPFAGDGGDTVALADALAPDLAVLVTHAGLGTLNDTRLAVDALDGHAVVVFLNHFDPGDDLHERNRAWLAARLGRPVVTDVEQLLDEIS